MAWICPLMQWTKTLSSILSFLRTQSWLFGKGLTAAAIGADGLGSVASAVLKGPHLKWRTTHCAEEEFTPETVYEIIYRIERRKFCRCSVCVTHPWNELHQYPFKSSVVDGFLDWNEKKKLQNTFFNFCSSNNNSLGMERWLDGKRFSVNSKSLEKRFYSCSVSKKRILSSTAVRFTVDGFAL